MNWMMQAVLLPISREDRYAELDSRISSVTYTGMQLGQRQKKI